MFRFGWALAVLWAVPAAAQLTHLQTFDWDNTHPRILGISGLEVSQDGQTYHAISDRGTIFTGPMVRQNGMLQAVPVAGMSKIRTQSGAVTRGAETDAEGLALTQSGSILISFENIHRVARFETIDAPARNLASVAGIPGLVGNRGFEALAVDAQDRPHAIGEVPYRGFNIVWRYQDGTWSEVLRIPNTDSFLVVGADFGPDGDLWVLERQFFPPFFASRIKRLDLKAARAEVIWRSTLGDFDNLESISLWTDGQDRTRVTLVSDDNDNWFQTTQIVELVLQD